MDVSRQQNDRATGIDSGPRARTHRLMLETATRMMQAGQTPSVSEVAEEAGVSRATAYRYFASQAALVDIVIDEALGPILEWRTESNDAEARVRDLLDSSLPRIDEFEATFRAALKLSLDQWADQEAGAVAEEPRFTRGHRVQLLKDAMEPLRGKVDPHAFDRLAQSLSLIFGVETLIVLKDIWHLDGERVQDVAVWAATALVRTTMEEAGPEQA